MNKLGGWGDYWNVQTLACQKLEKIHLNSEMECAGIAGVAGIEWWSTSNWGRKIRVRIHSMHLSEFRVR